MVNKIDSNATGLRFAEESSLKTLPGSPIWYPLEPNSYPEFGGSIATVRRNPINDIRQNLKGTVTDVNATGGFSTDLTQGNLTRLMQGFCFAAMREKPTSKSISGSPDIAMTAIAAADDDFTAASGLGIFLVNHLILASGFTNASNNGLHVVGSVSGTAISTSSSLVDEASPPDDAKIQAVGYQFASATLNVVVSGDLPVLSRASGSFDFTTLGLIPGEWIFIGDDSNSNYKFTNAVNNGFARVKSVTASAIELDKSESTMTAETGTGKTVRIFFGNVVKNEGTAGLIVRQTYQLERTLGNDGSGTASEYLTGAVPNSLRINMPTADKVIADLNFVACEHETRDGATGVKSGDRPSLAAADALNTTSDVRRLKMNIVDTASENPTALFGYVTDFSLSIENGITPTKAIGVLGAFDTSAGNFSVSGNVNAYFSSVDAIEAIRANSDVTMDVILTKNNAGLLFDIPLLSLGEGRIDVQQDQPIKLPVSLEASKNSLDYTLLFNEFPYLPDLAM